MAPSATTFPHPCPEISGYTLTEQLYLGSRTAVYRAVQTATQRPVVIKVLRRDYPSFGELVQFRNQYTIAKNLPIPGIVQPLSLELRDNGYALVMADEGGVALGKYIRQQSLGLTDVLAIAVQIADILHDLGQHRVVHKDIKPANILIHPESKEVKLIDFSIASLLPKETQEIQNPNILEGTLAYIAPEQTGRMNRCIDYRADFYALGVTLYQLLSGTLPFTSDDPLELIHCHLARVSVPVHEVSSGVPVMVSAIVTKLMAKNAEDRYQSALGLKHDLVRCLTEWETTGKISEFELGQRDLSDRFLIPEKLYGRATEVAQLLAAFERVADGAAELMLVAGFSGIGKTAVVNEVHKPIVRQHGYFIKGKFDQFNRNIPLSAFVQALRDLMGQLLSESDAQLAQWQAKILAAVGKNGQVLIEVIPELEQIIGKQPPAPELSGSAAQNRFNLLFQKFIEVFTTAEHPLVVFLDDLQWADSASLQLIQLLMNDNSYLLMLGAYRDNEVSPIHAFILTVEEIKKANAIVNTITLAPLAFADTNHLVADTLNCSRELAQPLTELIDRKTQGNPFFTTQFLKSLHDDGQITFHRERRYWECDIAQVNMLALTDDVVEFMALQLQKLPLETQQVLKLAACIGNQFDLTTLAIVSEQSQTDTANALWKALQDGLILPTSQIYKFFQSAERSSTEDIVNLTYRFLHDRVQQAAYSLIPDADKQITHLSIGRLLLVKIDNNLQHISSQRQADFLFDIVSHLNQGVALITQRQEKDELVQLNLQAGRRAKAATAFRSAADYYRMARTLIADISWETNYACLLEIYTESVEVSFLEGNFEHVNSLAQHTLENIHAFIDGAKVYEIKIQTLIAQDQHDEAIQLGLEFLDKLGFTLPSEVSSTTIEEAFEQNDVLLKTTPFETIATFELIEDIHKEAIVRMITIVGLAMYTVNPSLLMLAVAKQVNLCIQYGNTSTAADAYATYGLFLCGEVGNIEQGYKFGQLALDVLEKLQTTAIKSLVYALVYGLIKHWRNSYSSTLPYLQQAYQFGLETGDLQNAALSAYMYCSHLFICGDSLIELQTTIKQYLQAIESIQQMGMASWLRPFLWSTQQLIASQESPGQLCESDESEQAKIHEDRQADDRTRVFLFAFHQSYLTYLLGDNELATQQTQIARECLDGVTSMALVPIFYFYDTLILLAQAHSADEQTPETIEQKFQFNLVKLKTWAHYAPENIQHRLELVQAEYQHLQNNPIAALESYDRAISGAKANGYIQEAALANELAAKFYLNWDKEKVAAGYMQEAYYGYAQWGAKAKVQDLECRYPQLLAPILQQQLMGLPAIDTLSLAPSQTSTIQSSSSGSTSISKVLDLVTVLKASQALSSEIQLDKLLATLLHTVLENAGADKGALLMPQEQQWFVEAIAIVDRPAQIQSIALVSSSEVPQSLINTVKRSREAVVIVNASSHPTLAMDAYVMQQQPKSLLCTPILNQGKLIAILYLENHVTVGAFTSDRVELLNVLCAQAAISLDNARLYQQSQSYAQQLERSLLERKQAEAALIESEAYHRTLFDQASIGLALCNMNGQLLYFNPAYAKILGRTTDELPALTYWEITPEFYAEQEQLQLQSLQTTGRYGPYEKEYIHKDGHLIPVGLSGITVERNGEQLIWSSVEDISDRKASELALRESENKFRTLLSNLDGAVYRCHNDAAWTMEFISDYITTLTGYPASDFINNQRRTYANSIHPDDTARVDRIVGESVAQHQSFTIEYRIIHREGWVRWVSENGKGILDEQNQLRFLEGVIVDISDRKLAEENSRLLSSVVESSQDAIITKNLNSIITSWNQAATDLFGYTEDEAIGQSILILFPDDRIREESLIVSDLKQNKRIDSHETVRLHQDGSLIDCAVTISPLLTEDGKVIGASTILRDIRDRKRLEAEQQRLLDILEATPDYIGIASADGKILWYNKQLRELRQDLMIHKNIAECHPAWVNEIIFNQVFPILMEKGSWSGELALLDSNGKEIPVSQVIIAHKSQSGEIQYVSTIMRDISDRKAYEDRLEKNNAQLIHATRMKDEFLATMSHELRTPMNAILGMTEILQDGIFGAINEKQLKALATVERSGNHLLELINDILDVSKIASGQIELDYQNTAITPLCQQSLEFIKPQAAKKSIQTKIILPVDLPSLNLDERRIRQVIVNLLSNAVKFTPEGGCITLEVIYPITIKQQSYLQINIKDTGIGIAPENLQKVFEPFIQVDSALNRNYQGTGLGLALVKRIVELHQGEVTLTRELGVGSCFEIVLPYRNRSTWPRKWD